MVKIAPLSLEEILKAVSGEILRSDLNSSSPVANLQVTELGEPLEVGSTGVAFVISEAFVKDIDKTRAGVLVLQSQFAERALSLLPSTVKVCMSSKDAYLGLAHLSELIAERDPLADWRLSDSKDSYIHSGSEIDPTAKIGPGVVVCEGAKVGPRTVLLANAVVGPQVTIGADCLLFPGVVLYPRTMIGNRVRLHANVVIGSDGFGYARSAKGAAKIWHLGKVVIGDDVEIGSGTTVDRGTLKDTVIEAGAKIDNQCQIGHNGHVKAHAILCAQVGLAGNVTIGKGAILAGKAGVADKVEIGDMAILGPMSGLSKDLKPGEQVMGSLLPRPRREWWRLVASFERLPELYERVKKLEGK
ncbi:MAG: UDP-3-O-(3-hydroxymyristoyl)glucosamine N-acyltransferase [Bdellovibrionota bacterium]